YQSSLSCSIYYGWGSCRDAFRCANLPVHEPIDVFLDGRTDGLKTSRVFDLGPLPIRHIEHVGHLVSAAGTQGLMYVVIQSGRNPGRFDRQTELKDTVGNGIQQSLRIIGKHIDDRGPVTSLVIDLDLSRLASGRQ